MHVHRGVRYIYYWTLSAAHDARKRAFGPGDDKPRFYSTHPFQKTFMFFSVKLVYYFSDSHITKNSQRLFPFLFYFYQPKHINYFSTWCCHWWIPLNFFFFQSIRNMNEMTLNLLEYMTHGISLRYQGPLRSTGKTYAGRALNVNKWKKEGK